MSFSYFGMSAMLDYFLEKFVWNSYYSFLEHPVKFITEVIWSGILLWKCFNYKFNSLKEGDSGYLFLLE